MPHLEIRVLTVSCLPEQDYERMLSELRSFERAYRLVGEDAKAADIAALIGRVRVHTTGPYRMFAEVSA